MNLGFVFVPFPREIWEKEIELSQAEFRLLGWFLCNLKFGVSQLEVTDSQLLEGFRGERFSYPRVGLSRNAMKKARTDLIDKKLLLAKPLNEGGGRGQSAQWKYLLNLSQNDTFTDKPVTDGQNTNQDVTNNPSNSDGFPQAQIKEEREVQSSTDLPTPKDKPSEEEFTTTHIFRQDFNSYYQSKNGVPAPWGPKEASRLKKWIAENPTITREQWLQLLRNRYRSPVSHAKPLSYWIGTAVGWLNGPADDWGKAITGVRNGAVPGGKADGNLAVLEDSLNRGKRKSGANENGLLPASGN